MSLWVKICANTSLEDAMLAVEAGADAVGFVFAPSPRRVTLDQVEAITPLLPAEIEKIGVFVEAEFAAICEAVERCGLTGVQLHFGPDQAVGELLALLRERFGAELRLLRVMHFSVEAATHIQAAFAEANIDAVLVDSRTATAVGGTGVVFDWELARTTVFEQEHPMKLIAAGGLHPENVAEVIATLRPWGVDVASGVEAVPGRKDAAKVRAFVANARAAANN